MRPDKQHTTAMKLALQALQARSDCHLKESKGLFEQAFAHERAAAMAYAAKKRYEPTRGILFRSAAELAISAELYTESQECAFYGLQGNPIPRVREELLQALASARHSLVLQEMGQALSAESVLLAMRGRSAGIGMVPQRELISRTGAIYSLAIVAGRQEIGQSELQRGRPPQLISKALEPFLTVPRIASFAIEIKLGGPALQSDLDFDPGKALRKAMGWVEEIAASGMDAKLHGLDAKTSGHVRSCARVLFPDGQEIEHVDIGIGNGGRFQVFSLGNIPGKATSSRSRVSLDTSTEVETTIEEKQTLAGWIKAIELCSRSSDRIVLKFMVNNDPKRGRTERIYAQKSEATDLALLMGDSCRVEIERNAEGEWELKGIK